MNVIAFYNIKGGVGKTTAAVNIAYLSAEEGKRTLLWDLDPQGAASFYLRCKPKLDTKAKKFVKGKKDLSEFINETDFDNLHLLPADFKHRKLDIVLGDMKNSTGQFSKLLKSIKKEYDVVILDCPPSVSLVTDNILEAADNVVVPVVPSPLSIRSVEQLQSELMKKKNAPLQSFFSMVDRRKQLHRKMIEHPPENGNYCRMYIPYLSEIEQMSVRRCPLPALNNNTRGSQAFISLYHELFDPDEKGKLK